MIKIKDLEMLEDIDLVYKDKIILYGAGDYGRRALRLLNQLEIPVYGICDSNESMWGRVVRNHKILSIQELVEIYKKEHISIIVTMADQDNIEQVLETLESYGISEAECYTYFALKFTIEFHVNDQRISDIFRKNFDIAKMAFVECRWRGTYDVKFRFVFSSMLYDPIPILIWQPGKVGSSSVAISLEKRNIRNIHVHNLAEYCPIPSFSGNHIFDKLPPYDESKVNSNVKSFFTSGLEKIKIISLVREPISQSISWYFQLFDMDGYFLYDSGDDEDNVNICKQITDYLEKGLKGKNSKYGSQFDWFDRQIKVLCGIDVYQYDFDKEKGYQIIRKDNIELLLIKTERLNDCQEVMGQFIGIKDFKLEKENVGNKKPYKYVYDEVKEKIEIPEHIINFYYKGNKAMDHFYTEEEKQEFLKKWKRK